MQSKLSDGVFQLYGIVHNSLQRNHEFSSKVKVVVYTFLYDTYPFRFFSVGTRVLAINLGPLPAHCSECH